MKKRIISIVLLALLFCTYSINMVYADDEIEVEVDMQSSLIYVVKYGDTLWGIGQLFNTDYKEIMKNTGLETTTLYPGVELYIYYRKVVKGEINTYTVKKGDTLGEIAQLYGKKYKELTFYNNIEDPELIYPGQKLVIPTGQQMLRRLKGNGF